jgi:hypothetical protein
MTDIKDAVPYPSAPEERLYFPIGPKGPTMIVISGYQECFVAGNEDEDFFSAAEVHLMVGPFCRGILRVSPLVTVAGLDHPESDSDDGSGWYAKSCPWDAVSGLDGVPPDYERVLLKPVVGAKGENAKLTRFGYHAMIEAGELIDIMEPGPAHS